jgi:hypothetical protein
VILPTALNSAFIGGTVEGDTIIQIVNEYRNEVKNGDNFEAMIANQIARKGQFVTYRQISLDAPADPNKPWIVGTKTETQHNVKMVFLPDDFKNRETVRYMTGTEIPDGFSIAFMAKQSFTPKINDVITRDGRELVVRTFDIYRPAGSPLLYVFGLGE